MGDFDENKKMRVKWHILVQLSVCEADKNGRIDVFGWLQSYRHCFDAPSSWSLSSFHNIIPFKFYQSKLSLPFNKRFPHFISHNDGISWKF